MSDEERKELEQEYENLKYLLEFHSTFEVIESSKERQEMIDDILDKMNEIKKRIENK